MRSEMIQYSTAQVERTVTHLTIDNPNKNKCSLGSLCSLWQLLHDVDEFVGPVPGRADVNAEEVLLGGRGHGERVPLQLGDGRAVEEDVLTHLHFEAVLH